ncbi:MAG: 23S rRNA (pseudouridine(1915)-N(3))-methyltransferase RlmH, partial [Actinobacteria bacterium]|nr:23S rRNA (pseudouridine(1915)-N(3))-methyltransferase RlmH [Actinomycetota bacterium]
MKITIVAVGKLKEKFWKDAIAEYAKRLSGYATVRMVEVADYDPAKCGGEEAARIREGNDILAAVPSSSYVILLAIEARERSSEQFAAHLDELALHGTSDI